MYLQLHCRDHLAGLVGGLCQDRFDTAYETFRDLSEGLYDIDTRQCARGVTSDDAPDVKLSDGQAKLRELGRC